MSPSEPAVVTVATPLGEARAHCYTAGRARRGGVSLVLGHGAGGGIGARDLQALALGLPSPGLDVVLVEQPWRVAGKRLAPAPRRLDEAWTAVLASADLRLRPTVVVGGRSAGARVACRTAVATGATGVLLLAFPLHPPGRPDQTRTDELGLVDGLPLLLVQGERDSFGGPAEFPPGVPVTVVPGADHGFAVPARAPVPQGEALDLLVSAVAGWLAGLGEEAPARRR
jgi:predicted alpha/beta-hydrolase family hydrolase